MLNKFKKIYIIQYLSCRGQITNNYQTNAIQRSASIYASAYKNGGMNTAVPAIVPRVWRREQWDNWNTTFYNQATEQQCILLTNYLWCITCGAFPQILQQRLWAGGCGCRNGPRLDVLLITFVSFRLCNYVETHCPEARWSSLFIGPIWTHSSQSCETQKRKTTFFNSIFNPPFKYSYILIRSNQWFHIVQVHGSPARAPTHVPR